MRGLKVSSEEDGGSGVWGGMRWVAQKTRRSESARMECCPLLGVACTRPVPGALQPSPFIPIQKPILQMKKLRCKVPKSVAEVEF